MWTWDSGAFGAEAPTGSATVNLRFPGQYYDAETGLHYNWHRYYDPTTGRYITSDPLGLAAGLNTYGYAAQNPLSFVDPDGQFIHAIGGAVVVGTIFTGILLAITAYNNWDKITDAWNGKLAWRDLANQLGPQALLDAALGYSMGLAAEAIGARILANAGGAIAKGLGRVFGNTASKVWAKAIRQQYERAVKNLRKLEKTLREAGESSEEIARKLFEERKKIQKKYRDMTPPEILEKIYERNIKKYGNAEGPSIEQLREMGKSWDDIIESATRSGGKDIVL